MTGCRNHVFHAPGAADGRGFFVARRRLSCRSYRSYSWRRLQSQSQLKQTQKQLELNAMRLLPCSSYS